MKIVEALQNAGFSSFYVGGCVRDYVMSRDPHDYDICTAATPEQMIEILTPLTKEIIPTGIKHGTITAVMEDGSMYEVTTFRVDGKYSDGRHPDSVSFTSDIEEDLARRDFTINAMAMKWPEAEIIDPFGGRSDCEKEQAGGILKCVGDPYERFKEDPLRILRGVRFIAQLGLENTEASTWGAMHQLSSLLRNISAERISSELAKIMQSNQPEVIMFFPEILFEIIPEMKPMLDFCQNNPYHRHDVFTHTQEALRAFIEWNSRSQIKEPIDRLEVATALLLHDIGKPSSYSEELKDGIIRGHFYGHEDVSAEMARTILTRLRFSKNQIDQITELIEAHNKTILPQEKLIRRLMNKHGVQQTRNLLYHNLCDTVGRGGRTLMYHECVEIAIESIQLFEEMLTRPQAFTVKDLAISGKDVMSLGIGQGKAVGSVLNRCLELVMDEQIPNERDTLMAAAKEHVNVLSWYLKMDMMQRPESL